MAKEKGVVPSSSAFFCHRNDLIFIPCYNIPMPISPKQYKNLQERGVTQIDLISPPLPALKTLKTPLHEALGVSPEYTRRQYMKIVHQDENLPSKLKAIAPLARELGLEPDPEQAASTQNIIIMMPPEIAQKNHLIIHDIGA